MPVLPAVHPRTVLITGCSTGIGAATATVLRERGWEVLPTARRDQDLERLRSEGFHAIALDVASSESIAQAAESVLAHGGGRVGAVVNNAGYGQAGAVEDLSRDALRRQFEVNVFGLQELTNRLIPGFRRQGYGRIVNVTSVLGRISMPFNAAYSASKYAVEALSDGLRIELHRSGIGVSLIEPGPIESEFGRTAAARARETLDGDTVAHAELYRALFADRDQRPGVARRFTLPPEAVAAKIAHALESPRPRRRYGVTVPAHAVAFVRRFFPDGLTDAVMVRSVAKHNRPVPPP